MQEAPVVFPLPFSETVGYVAIQHVTTGSRQYNLYQGGGGGGGELPGGATGPAMTVFIDTIITSNSVTENDNIVHTFTSLDPAVGVGGPAKCAA